MERTYGRCPLSTSNAELESPYATARRAGPGGGLEAANAGNSLPGLGPRRRVREMDQMDLPLVIPPNPDSGPH